MQVRFRVHGEVQGVGYRRFAARAAQSQGLSGWVRNDLDGSVSGEAGGREDALEAFRAELARGPSCGRVEQLDWEARSVPFSLPLPFEIRR